MRVSSLSTLLLAGSAFAARPFLNEPDTGIEDALGKSLNGVLPPLKGVVGLPDFDWVARQIMNITAYSYYRNGAAGKLPYWSLNCEFLADFVFQVSQLFIL